MMMMTGRGRANKVFPTEFLLILNVIILHTIHLDMPLLLKMATSEPSIFSKGSNTYQDLGQAILKDTFSKSSYLRGISRLRWRRRERRGEERETDNAINYIVDLLNYMN